ncbi:MAG: type II toxin-antitoxin system PemK/MazF family toxin, partial [Treponema sp.]
FTQMIQDNSMTLLYEGLILQALLASGLLISKKESGLPKDSVALVHQIIVVDKFRLKEKRSKLSKSILLKIEQEIDYVTKD